MQPIQSIPLIQVMAVPVRCGGFPKTNRDSRDLKLKMHMIWCISIYQVIGVLNCARLKNTFKLARLTQPSDGCLLLAFILRIIPGAG